VREKLFKIVNSKVSEVDHLMVIQKVNYSPESEVLSDEQAFLVAIQPLIIPKAEELKKEIEALSSKQSYTPFEPQNILEKLYSNLTSKLLNILDRTLVLELNVARLKGLLKGNTPSERFQNFVELLKQPDYRLSLFQEYPVLVSQVTITIDNWLKYSREFLDHLCQDWNEICKVFFDGKNPGVLTELIDNKGDSHRQGRSVMIVKFASGLQVVYKPKNLSIDFNFQQLLTWLNNRGNNPYFKTLKIINRTHYGWVEYIENKSCETKEEINNFYQRLGNYLAVFYVLQGTDCHCDNIVASGEYPMPIDLETLFHNIWENEEVCDDIESEKLAFNQMNRSVLSVGLLPQKIWSNPRSFGIDLSGFAALPGQFTPTPVPIWESLGTDEMRMSRKIVELPAGNNRPSLNGKDVNLLEFTEEIISGFRTTYEIIRRNRDQMLAPHGPLANFANDEVRVVLQEIQKYFKLLYESFHPDLLHDYLDRDKFFDHLWKEVIHFPELEKVIPTEKEDLWENDIPIFTTRTNSYHLWTSKNKQITNFFSKTGLEQCQQRLKELSEKDQEQQMWFIRASLATLGMEIYPSYSKSDKHFVIQNRQYFSQEKYLFPRLKSIACAVGDRLETLAWRGEQDATWLGLSMVSEKECSILPLNSSLYDGLSGVILFLAYLGSLTNENRYTNLAKAAFKTLQHQIKQEDNPAIGAFSGKGGIIYTLTHLGVLWNQSDLLSQAEELVRELPPLITLDESFDLIAGASGCIATLLNLYKIYPQEKILEVACQCGDRLISQAKPLKTGVGWMVEIEKMQQQALSGFSHGAAGIAWALLKLSALTKEKKYYKTALEAINYERSLFYPELSNWLDLREFTKDQQNQHICMTAWCHGAPGIGLARLLILPYLDDLTTRAEINTAINTTLKNGFGDNHSLCHGDLGNLELILQASLTLNHPQCQKLLNSLSINILDSIEQQGLICGVPLGVETPGLMTGLAGIGYGLLRLAYPDQIPSVLTLDAPKLK